MAVHLKPCHGCKIKHTGNAACDALHDQMRNRVSGLGLKTASFDCTILAGIYKPGTRIEIGTPIVISGDYGMTATTRVPVKATITSYKNGKFTCVVDRTEMLEAMEASDDTSVDPENPEKFMPRRAKPVSSITRVLDEPPVAICDSGNPKTADDGYCELTNCWCRSAFNDGWAE